MELYSFNRSYGQNAQHFVFCPKYRRDIFADPEVKQGCEQILREIAQTYKLRIYEMQVMPDHVHLFVEIPPTTSVAKALQLLKGISSRELRKRYPQIQKKLWGKHFWSPGKFHRSVGNVTADTIQHYIAQSQGNFVRALPRPF